MTTRIHNKKTVSTVLFTLAALCWSSLAFAQTTIDSVRLHRAPDHTRIVFDLPAPVDHKLDKLANPDRIVLDLQDAALDFDVKTLDYDSSPIANIRVGKHTDKTRVVLDMNESVRTRTNLLKPIDPHGWRLVVDLFDKELQTAKADKPKPQKPAEPKAQRLMIVAIDAGHGGEDPGARGPSGTYEKTIVLQIAKKLEALVNGKAGMRAVMVRDGDYYVPLVERRKIAREKHGADVFVSIHADAFTDARAHGASVFALSNRGATSARARYLAKIANESDRVAGVYEEEEDDSSLYGVLAVLPVLALPLLMGGVTNDQFWRTAGALLNILIFSLSMGMFFSALSWSSGRAVFWTFFSLFSVTMLPLIHLWLGGTASALNFVSPGFAMANASAPVIGTPAAGFSGHWAWLGSGLAVSGMLLVLASWTISHRWRETKPVSYTHLRAHETLR